MLKLVHAVLPEDHANVLHPACFWNTKAFAKWSVVLIHLHGLQKGSKYWHGDVSSAV